MSGLVADLKHALSIYRQTPVASLLAVTVLAIAMAVIAGLLSLWSDLALKGPPGFERSGELVTVMQTDGQGLRALSHELIERIDEETASLDGIAGVLATGQTYDRDGESTQVLTELVTRDYFPGIRPRLQIGRPFDADDHDPSASPVIILSDAFWRKDYGGRPDVLGEILTIRGPEMVVRTPDGEARPSEQSQDYRIVGVLAPEVRGTFYMQTEVWMPYEQAAEALLGSAGPGYRRFTNLMGIARLAPGASANAVRAEIGGRFGGDDGQALGIADGFRIDALAGIVPDVNAHRETLRQLRLFLAGAGLLALVAACNVSLFLLSRAPGRRRELSIRMAVGAPLKRLARQLVTEAGLLVTAAAIVGLLVSFWLAAVMTDLAFLQSAQFRDASVLDWRVLGLVAGIALLLTLFVSLAPVSGLRRLGLAAGARIVSARAGPVHRLAGTLQATIAAVIGGAALAFVWYLVELERVDPGFTAPGVKYVLIQPPPIPRDFGFDVEAIIPEREHRRDVIAAIPGVEAVAFGTTMPGMARTTNQIGIRPPEAPEETLRIDLHTVDADYFRVLGATLVDGRHFEAADRDAVIVNATLAERIWGRTDVAGEILPTVSGNTPLRWEVIGVVADIAFGHPAEAPEPMVFHSAIPTMWYEWILVRTPMSNAALREAIQARIDDGELDFRPYLIRNVEDAWHDRMAPDRARTWLTVASAGLVVALAVFGFYGTQRFLVAAGRREYAILAALGAGPRALGRLVLRRSALLGLPGLALGALLSFIVVAWMRGDFVSDSVSPVAAAAAVTLGILGLLLAATIGPARQAGATEPAPLLKQD